MIFGINIYIYIIWEETVKKLVEQKVSKKTVSFIAYNSDLISKYTMLTSAVPHSDICISKLGGNTITKILEDSECLLHLKYRAYRLNITSFHFLLLLGS